MGKNILSEDINKMMGLIGYDRSKTASEQQYTKFGQKPTLIKEASETIAFENYDDVSVGYSKDANGNLIVSDDSQIRQLSKGLEDALDAPIDDEDIENVYDTYTLVNKLFLEDKTPACQLLNDYYSDQTGNESVATEIKNAGFQVDNVGDWFGGWADDDDMTFKGQAMTYGRAKRLTLKVIDSCGSVKWNEGQKDPDPDVVNEDLTAVWKDFPCVLTTIEGGKGKNGKTSDGTIWKWKNPEKTQVLVQIGDAIAVFGNGGRFVYKGPDYKDGAEILKGNYTCKGDELNLAGPAELSLSEGKVLTKKLISQIKNYILSEQINFGGMVLPVPEVDQDPDPVKPGPAPVTNKCDWTQILSGKCVAKKGQKGDVIIVVQEKLEAAGHDVGDAGADGDFGPDTETAVIAFQEKAGLPTEGIVEVKTAEALDGGAANTEQEEDKIIEDEVDQIKTPQDAQKAIDDIKGQIKALKGDKQEARKKKRGLKKLQRICKKHPNIEGCKGESLAEWIINNLPVI